MRNGIQWLFSIFGNNKLVDATMAWKEVFDTDNENVKIILKDLAYYCNFTSSSFVKGDEHHTNFNEGARDVFLHILEMSDIDLNTILEILRNENLK